MRTRQGIPVSLVLAAFCCAAWYLAALRATDPYLLSINVCIVSGLMSIFEIGCILPFVARPHDLAQTHRERCVLFECLALFWFLSFLFFQGMILAICLSVYIYGNQYPFHVLALISAYAFLSYRLWTNPKFKEMLQKTGTGPWFFHESPIFSWMQLLSRESTSFLSMCTIIAIFSNYHWGSSALQGIPFIVVFGFVGLLHLLDDAHTRRYPPRYMSARNLIYVSVQGYYADFFYYVSPFLGFLIGWPWLLALLITALIVMAPLVLLLILDRRIPALAILNIELPPEHARDT